MTNEEYENLKPGDKVVWINKLFKMYQGMKGVVESIITNGISVRTLAIRMKVGDLVLYAFSSGDLELDNDPQP